MLVPQSPTLCNPMHCGSLVHWILQARILEWVAIPFSRGSSWPRDRTWVSYIAGRFFIIWTTGKSGYSRGTGVSLWGLGIHPNWSNDLLLTLELLVLSVIAQVNPQTTITSAFFSSLCNPVCERLQAPKEPKAGLPPFHFLFTSSLFYKCLPLWSIAENTKTDQIVT